MFHDYNHLIVYNSSRVLILKFSRALRDLIKQNFGIRSSSCLVLGWE